jgi:hypothetical protein
MIVSISARCKAGKTTLADQLVPMGFTKASFADKLKQLVGDLYNLNKADLSDVKKKEQKLDIPLKWNISTALKLSSMLGIPPTIWEKNLEFWSIRDAMQIIGTEILRKYDNDFHVKELKKQITPDQNWVIDDARFVNEHKMFKKLNAHCLFVVRPNFEIYYNHESETSLNRTHFEYVLVNDGTKEVLINKFKKFINGIGKFEFSRADIVDALKHKKPSLALGCTNAYLKQMTDAYLIYKPDREYNGLFITKNKESNKWFDVVKQGTITIVQGKKRWSIKVNQQVKDFAKAIEYKKEIKENLVIRSPYFIDDLKLFNYS